jgi:hypothetical protein
VLLVTWEHVLSSFAHTRVVLHCTAMIRQVNPHWHAYFLITDEKPFEEELTSILAGFGDSRLHFLDISMDYRPPVRVQCLLFCAAGAGVELSPPRVM